MEDYLEIIKKNPVLKWFVAFIGHLFGIWRPTEIIAIGRKASDPHSNRIKRLYYVFKYQRICDPRNIYIPSFEQIGEGFVLAHPGGVLIHKKAKIGKNCTVFKGVSIGIVRGGKRAGVPTLEDRVVVCANAMVFGNITIGHDTLIAANAFVDFDVPPHSVVIGNPGVIHHKENASADYVSQS